MNKQNKGIALAGMTAVISGFAIFFNKFAVTAIKPALVFTATKNLWVGVMIVGMLLLLGKWKLVRKLKNDEVFKLLLVALIGGTLPFYLFFTGLTQTSAISAALIQKTLVIWVSLLAIKFLKEKITKVQILAVGILFAANLVVGGFPGFKFNTGELMILAATLMWSVEYVIAKKALKTIDPDIVTGARMGLGSLVLMAAALIQSPAAVVQAFSLAPINWMWLLVSAGTLMLYVMTWYRALRLEKATTVTAILVASTLVTNVLSAILVTHQWSLEMGIQAVLVVIGVGLIYWQGKKVVSKSVDQLASESVIE